MSCPSSSMLGARSLLSCSAVTGKQGSNCAELLFLAPVCRERSIAQITVASEGVHACMRLACLSLCVCVQLRGHVWLFVTPWTARLLCSWDSPGKNTGVGCPFPLQGIFPTQGSTLHLLLCRQVLYLWATWEIWGTQVDPQVAKPLQTCAKTNHFISSFCWVS